MPKQKIFDTAVQLVTEHGTDVSVRQIAKAADVNVAAISYHFGNKDNLINEVIIYKLQAFKQVFAVLENTEVAPIVRLEQYLNGLLAIIAEHPEIADYVISQQDLFKTRYEYQQYLESVGYSKLVNLVSTITNITSVPELTIIIEHMLSAVVMSYISELKLAQLNIDYKQEINHDYRIKLFINNYFYQYIETEKE